MIWADELASHGNRLAREVREPKVGRWGTQGFGR